MKLILRLAINAVALLVAAYAIDGIHLRRDVVSFLVVALVFGLVNAFIKPVVKFFAFPIILLTLGLFTLLINTLLFGLTAYLTEGLDLDGFVPAFLGSLVVSVVSVVLSWFLVDDDKK
jgi:putative membrane protein